MQGSSRIEGLTKEAIKFISSLFDWGETEHETRQTRQARKKKLIKDIEDKIKQKYIVHFPKKHPSSGSEPHRREIRKDVDINLSSFSEQNEWIISIRAVWEQGGIPNGILLAYESCPGGNELLALERLDMRLRHHLNVIDYLQRREPYKGVKRIVICWSADSWLDQHFKITPGDDKKFLNIPLADRLDYEEEEEEELFIDKTVFRIQAGKMNHIMELMNKLKELLKFKVAHLAMVTVMAHNSYGHLLEMHLEYGLPMEDMAHHTESDHLSGENRIHGYYTNTCRYVGDCLLEAIKDIREKISEVEQRNNPSVNPTYAPVTFSFLKPSNPMRDLPLPKQDCAYRAPNNNYPLHRQHDATDTHPQLHSPRPVPLKSDHDVTQPVQHHRPSTSEGSEQPNGRDRHQSTISGNERPTLHRMSHGDKDGGKINVLLSKFGIELERDHVGREVFASSPVNSDSELETSSTRSGNRPSHSNTEALPMKFYS